MAPAPDPIEGSSDLPSEADVVVIGGGIIGVCTAFSLAERGVSVALVEKGEIGAEQSSRNWGWCRQMGRDPREIPLIVESLTLWRTLNERIGAEAGFRQSGILYAAATDKELDVRAAWLKYAREYQLDSHIVGADKVAEMLPGSTVKWKGALYTPTDGRAEPTRATPAIARAAQAKGAFIARRCAARGIERSAGRVSAVVTERGTIKTNSVVLAGGAWSRLFAGNAGVYFPQLKVINSVMRSVPFDAGFDTSTSGGGFSVRKRLDGGYTIAQQHLNIVDIVPDSFKLLLKFWPALTHDPWSLRFRVGKTFVKEASFPKRWALDPQRRGPRGSADTLVVRRKSNVAGLWMNTPSMSFTFDRVPSYYAIASTRPISEIAEAQVLAANAIGFEFVKIRPKQGRVRTIPEEEEKSFRDAVVRLKQKDGVYISKEYDVTFIGRSLFRTTIQLPANIAVGPLDARVYLFREGKLLSHYTSRVTLERAGVELWLHGFANRYPLFYGFFTVAVAVAAGLLASAFFRAGRIKS